jgi:hypothetical protein
MFHRAPLLHAQTVPAANQASLSLVIEILIEASPLASQARD